MTFKTVKRSNIHIGRSGPRSELSALLPRIKKMKPEDGVVIKTPKNQREVYNRVRVNVSKWKKTKGLTHASVHLTDDGNVAVIYSPKK